MYNLDQTSALALAAAISMSKEIIQEVSDETYTDMLNGNVISSDVLAQMIGASINKRISDSMKYNSQEKK